MSLKRSLPSLNALLALEAAARHNNFTRAAEELGVTQTAVSRHILSLEDRLRVQLFQREGRVVAPTPQCTVLASNLRRQFVGMVEALREFERSTSGQVVTLGATTAFAQLWLLPRLVDFRRAHPEVKVRLNVSDEPFDLTRGAEDIVIRYGVEPFADGESIASRGDVLYPVASPDYRARLGNAADTFWDGDHDLISTISDRRDWYSWDDWFRALDLPRRSGPPALTFNHFPDALYAARAGQGIALGWDVLVQTYLSDGTLVRLGHANLVAEGRFHVVLSRSTPPRPALLALAHWLQSALLSRE